MDETNKLAEKYQIENIDYSVSGERSQHG